MSEKEGLVKWFSELSSKDIAVAGGKGASLAEMYNNKFPIPPGFIITAEAYTYFVTKAGLQEKIDSILHDVDIENTEKLQKASQDIRLLIESASLPKDLEEHIIEAYDVLDVNREMLGTAKATALSILKNSHEPPFVAIRSSATTEDLAEASFAGQQDSFLNVKGHRNIVEKVKSCFSSLFTARAIYYRLKKGFGAASSQLAVVVQKMVDSDKSGVMFSKNPINNAETVMIEAVWGLGEGIVSGMIKPDNYILNKDLEVLTVSVSEKKVAIVRTSAGENGVVKLTGERSKQQVLTTHELKILAQYALKLEKHYKKPQDIEFAISRGEIYIVQSRPITTKVQTNTNKELHGEELLKGLGASPGVASGVVKVIHNLTELKKIQKGDVLVTEMTNPDMVVAMQKAAAIITDEGGITSHASIISREMGIACVVGTGEATKKLQDGDIVTVDGFNGRVLAGKGEAKAVEILPVVETRTKLRVLVDMPGFAVRAAQTGIKAVGLVRLEGVIASSGKHPLAFVKAGKEDDYAQLIAKGVDTIAQHFEELWVRSSDLRSDEYLHLEGAPQEHEGNPMLGNHGIRFSLQNLGILDAELAAVKMIAEKHPDKRFGFMIPQVITVEEVKKTMARAEKLKMPSNCIFGIMVETPAAVQVINELCATGIKFISFGTNDLTQYMLALDRNNAAVQPLYDEMNPAVLSALSYVIRRCKKFGVQTSICGQAGSMPEMVKFLLKEGIDSISVNADAARAVSEIIRDLEDSSSVGQEIVENAESPDTEEKAENEKSEKMPLKDQDIEQIILKELDTNEYQPGSMPEKDADMPKLNDAIAVDPQHLEDEIKIDVV